MKTYQVAVLALITAGQAFAKFKNCSPLQDRVVYTKILCGTLNFRNTDVDYLIDQIPGSCGPSGGSWTTPQTAVQSIEGPTLHLKMDYSVTYDGQSNKYKPKVGDITPGETNRKCDVFGPPQ